MPSPQARALIVAYAGVLALLDLFTLLPGNPDFGPPNGVVFGLGIQALIVWRLWHGSELAWLFAVALPGLAIVSLILMAAGTSIGILVMIGFCFLQIGILCTPPITNFVWSRRRPTTPAPR